MVLSADRPGAEGFPTGVRLESCDITKEEQNGSGQSRTAALGAPNIPGLPVTLTLSPNSSTLPESSVEPSQGSLLSLSLATPAPGYCGVHLGLLEL